MIMDKTSGVIFVLVLAMCAGALASSLGTKPTAEQRASMSVSLIR